MVEIIPHADWCIFGKNGSDATTTSVHHRPRRDRPAQGFWWPAARIMGAVPWCSPSVAGVTAEDRAHLVYFDFNDIPSLEAAVEQAGTDLAAVLVSAFKHDMGLPQEMPTQAFARRVRDLCDETGAALVLDDVRAGFRLSLAGSWDSLGVQPDLAAWSKAIANGHALAAVTGRDRFSRGGDQGVHHRVVLVWGQCRWRPPSPR